MGRLDRLMRPFARRASGPALAQLDQRLEATAARIEAHTVNLAEYQAQLRDETMRQIINEVRANSAFFADSTIALDRLNARRADLTHAAVRPLVHTARAALASETAVIVVDHVDPVLVDELVTDGHPVTVVEPSVDYPLPPEVVVSTVAIGRFRGPSAPVWLVVWVARSRPLPSDLDTVRGWMNVGGSCILATPDAVADAGGFAVADRREFSRTESGRFARLDGRAHDTARRVDLYVHHLVAT
jgi:hypothetical protein